MAVVGDILIKLVADFAQFAEGMTQSVKQLETFGNKFLETKQKIEGFIANIYTVTRVTGIAFAIDKVTAYTDKVQQMSVEVAKLAQQFNLSAREIQGLQLAAKETGQPLEKLAEYAKTHGTWLENAALRAEALGQTIDGSVVRSMKTMNDEAEIAQRRLDVLFAAPVAAGKSWIVEQLDRLVADLNALSAHADLIDKIAGFFRLLTFGGSTGSGQMAQLGEYVAAATKAEAALASLEAQQKQNAIGMAYPVDPAVLAAARQRAEDTRIALGQYRDQQARAGYGGTMPATVVTGDKPTGGGGGGRTDDENIDAQIARFKALEDAARKTGETIEKYHATNIEDFQREIRVQQQVEEIAAKLGAKYSEAGEARQKALHDQIAAALEAKSANDRLLEGAQRAAEIERKYGDGTAASAKTRRDLDLAEKSNIATKDALARATKVQQEADEQQRLEGKRTLDNMDALAAGFEHAANAYARSHDMFTQGGEIFSAVTGAMGEGLDVLLGKSTKTFGQIAADFATMLTKMALQAALSPVFKIISNSIGGLFGTGATADSIMGLTPVAAGTATTRAGGGAVYAGQPYWVGEQGPERFVPSAAGSIQPAGGGDVYVSIANYTDSKVSAQKSKGPGGQMQVDVIVEAVEGKMAARLSRGQGALGKTMEGKYGLQPIGR